MSLLPPCCGGDAADVAMALMWRFRRCSAGGRPHRGHAVRVHRIQHVRRRAHGRAERALPGHHSNRAAQPVLPVRSPLPHPDPLSSCTALHTTTSTTTSGSCDSCTVHTPYPCRRSWRVMQPQPLWSLACRCCTGRLHVHVEPALRSRRPHRCSPTLGACPLHLRLPPHSKSSPCLAHMVVSPARQTRPCSVWLRPIPRFAHESPAASLPAE